MVAEKTQLQELHKAIDHVSTSLHEFIDLMFANNHGSAPVTEKAESASVKKKAKDPNAPKRNLSSYMLYSQAVRPKVVEENPQLKAVDIAKLVGEMWNKLSEKEKNPYVKEAEKEKLRYEKETANYKTSLGETSSDANTKRKEPSKKTKSRPQKSKSP
ncbi:high mobility group box domain-containing protein [Sporodiniella umbellata]|nr:high mobility group box domain-containing protein [Sporodiniella umbellata]